MAKKILFIFIISMQITSNTTLNNSYSSSFGARNKKVREADKIQRTAKHTFPALSPSYMRKFYSIFKKNEDGTILNENNRKYEIKRKSIDQNISEIRAAQRYNSMFNNFGISDGSLQANNIMIALTGVEKYKTANCEECAKSIVGLLASQGYNDAQAKSIKANIKFVDKATNKVEREFCVPCDHCAVETSLSKTNDKEDSKDKVIIDSWLGFADSVSGAKARYKAVFAKEIDAAVNNFVFQNSRYKPFPISKYDVKTSIFLEPKYSLSQESMEKLGFHYNLMFGDEY